MANVKTALMLLFFLFSISASARCLTQAENTAYLQCSAELDACRSIFNQCLAQNGITQCSFSDSPNLPIGACSVCSDAYQSQTNCISQTETKYANSNNFNSRCLPADISGGAICVESTSSSQPSPETERIVVTPPAPVQASNTPGPTSQSVKAVPVSQCPDIGIPAIQSSPGSLELTFPALRDEVGTSILKINCGNGNAKQAECTDSTCNFFCQYSSTNECPNGVCVVKIFSCDSYPDTRYDSGSPETTFKRYACEVQNNEHWRLCLSASLQLKEKPTGCNYNNPPCASNEACQYNQCIKKECDVDADCSTDNSCQSASCKDFQCVKTNGAGCSFSSSCLPYGNRQEQKYCEVTGQMTEQKENSQACQNNYECKTNFCSNGKCLDVAGEVERQGGLIEQILAFLRSLFGIK